MKKKQLRNLFAIAKISYVPESFPLLIIQINRTFLFFLPDDTVPRPLWSGRGCRTSDEQVSDAGGSQESNCGAGELFIHDFIIGTLYVIYFNLIFPVPYGGRGPLAAQPNEPTSGRK